MRFTQLVGTALAVVAACAMFARTAEPPKKPVKAAPPAVKVEAKKPAAKDACPDGKCSAPQARAPKGGVTVRGKFFAGGQFLPMPKGNGPTVVKASSSLSTRMKVRVRAHSVRGQVRSAVLRIMGR